MNTREVIESYYRYASPQDRAQWLALFDPDVVLEEQLVGRVVGLRALTELIAALDAAYPEFRAVPRHVVIEGDQACVIEDISTTTADGVAIEVRAASYFRIAGGKITHFSNVHDTAPFPRPRSDPGDHPPPSS
jgi:ketosteroid isomerase-like protein